MGENAGSMRKHVVLLSVALMAACTKQELKTPSAPPAAARAKPAIQTQTTPVATPAAQAAEVGQAMPAYTTDLLDGKKFDIAAERGNVVFLNLWATWCGPCRYEIPELQAMHQKYASRGFKVVGISLDDPGVDSPKKSVSNHSM